MDFDGVRAVNVQYLNIDSVQKAILQHEVKQ